jgi:DnaJ-class molecular chaperone
MQDHYDRLGLKADASDAEIKTAYHAKLREFPAHTHPQDFKAIRVAYEALRQGGAKTYEAFFKPQFENAEVNPESVKKLRERVSKQVEVSLDELIRLTF